MDEELLKKQVPQSLEAEQAVLGSILIDSRCITDVVGLIKPEDFYLQANREIFETIYTMFNYSQTIDPVTVLDKMKELGYPSRRGLRSRRCGCWQGARCRCPELRRRRCTQGSTGGWGRSCRWGYPDG